MDEFVCPWCGTDLLPLFASMRPCSFDAVYEAHAPECEPFLREQGLLEDNNESPLCDGDEE